MESKIHLRLIISLYFISCFLIIQTPTYILIKALLIGLLSLYLYKLIGKKSSLIDVILSRESWTLVYENGASENYDEVYVIIHNAWFQLIKLHIAGTQKLLVIFNDQVTTNQLRLLHAKSINSSFKRLLLKKHMVK
jgi:hypothetical protein